MKKHEQYCATCWNYSNTLGRCMITQCSERPDHVCKIGMHTNRNDTVTDMNVGRKKEESRNDDT